jgi:tripartite-type tricarboxylate transporter receptor subunit TctC
MRRRCSVRSNRWMPLYIVASLQSLGVPAAADTVADFYRGKTLTISVGFTAGGGYDMHARLLARHLSRHVPGAPGIVVKNVPGAAGLGLVNSLYNASPRDGTEIATFDRAIPLDPLLDGSKTRFDALKLSWIGSTDSDASTCFAWHTSRVKTIDDLLKEELIVGATGSIGDAVSFPRLLNATLGTKFRVITGYPGSAEALIAVERGETQGFCSMGFATLEVTRPQWVRERKVNVLVQLALQKNRDHPEVPLAGDLAKTAADRQAIELIVSPNLFARPFTAPPGVPAERVEALRKAFDATVTDPEFVTEADKRGMHVQLVTGQEIEDVLRRVYAMPKEIVERVREAVK